MSDFWSWRFDTTEAICKLLKKKRFLVLTKVLKYYLGIGMSLAAKLTLGLTAGCIGRLAMFMFSSLQCLILTHGLPPVLST